MSQPARAVKGHPALQPAPSVEEMTARVMEVGIPASLRAGAVRQRACRAVDALLARTRKGCARVEVPEGAARGTFTLKWWGQEAGSGSEHFDGVTFP
jgi:hypothetical protein